MRKFETGDFDPAFRSSQKTIELLESVSPMELAQSVPFIKVTRVEKGKPVGDPLNMHFMKPPEFGSSIAEKARYGNRPPVSLQKFTVMSKTNIGPIVLQEVEMDLIVHRPDALFTSADRKPTGDSIWVSLITPGQSHIVEYGWKGSSRNPLFNGEGYADKDAKDQDNSPILIDSIKSILFTTYYYTFSIAKNGEISIKVKGWQNGDYALRRMFILESKKDSSSTSLDTPTSKNIDKKGLKGLRKKLQEKIENLPGNYIKLVDIVNELEIGNTIANLSKEWNYKDVKLMIGNFNDSVPMYTTEKYGKTSLRGKSIGDFLIHKREITKLLGNQLKLGRTITIKNFLSSIFTIPNRPDAWAAGKYTDRRPTVKIKVSENKLKNKEKELVVLIFDIQRELIKVDKAEAITKFDSREQTRSDIKKKLKDRNIPMISLGKATSFIADCQFEVILDNDIQRIKIEEAARVTRDRPQMTAQTEIHSGEEMPENFHILWSSAMQGNISMIGNFAFDTFGLIWIDFGIPIWDGFFNIRKRTDELTAGSFTTSIEVYSEGDDPFNTKRKLSRAQMKRDEEVADMKKRNSEKLSKVRNRRRREALRKELNKDLQDLINKPLSD